MAEAYLSEMELVDQAREGSVEAFTQLVERNQDYIYNMVCHLMGGERDAEDIAQEVFIRAYRHLDRFEGRARFSTWLYGIMLNCVRSFWRRRRVRATVSLNGRKSEDDGRANDPPARQDGPAELAERDEQVRTVRAAIAGLEDDLREIVVLRDIQGLSYEEMAETLELPAGTVKSRLHRARLALKEVLAPLYGEMV